MNNTNKGIKSIGYALAAIASMLIFEAIAKHSDVFWVKSCAVVVGGVIWILCWWRLVCILHK